MYLNDEMYEVIDIDEAIKQKQDLITQAQALSEEAGDQFKAASRLRKKWRKIPYWESAYEDQLANEFEGYLNAIYGRRHLAIEESIAAKKALIDEVNKCDGSTKASTMDEILEKWKKVGSAGKENDDELWKEFANARREFYARKHEHWDNLKSQFQEAKASKLRIIEEAKALLDETNFYETSNKFEALLEEWKKAGWSGKREEEDKLWEEFIGLRHEFYKKRNAFFNEVRTKQKEAIAAKRALIAEARAIVEKDSKNREDTQAMKELNVKWREVGSAGKDREDKLWKEFREVVDSYFDGLRLEREAHESRKQERSMDLKARKTDQIASLQRQIEHLKQEAAETLSEREAEEINEEIADKEDYILELEAQIKELD